MRSLPSIAVLSLLTLLLFTPGAEAQVYKWRDATGKIHYSDKPPAGMPAQNQNRKLGPANSASDDLPAAQKSAADRRLETATRDSEAKEKAANAERERAQEAQRAQACERAKVNLQGLESGQIRFRLDKDGEREALDGAVREAELNEARRAVDSACAPRPAAKTGK